MIYSAFITLSLAALVATVAATLDRNSIGFGSSRLKRSHKSVHNRKSFNVVDELLMNLCR